MYQYYVEVIYKQAVIRKDPDSPITERRTEVATQTYGFESGKKENARRDAERFMDSTIRYGLKLSGGAVIKSVIHPSAILQVGLVDKEILDKEQELGLEAVAPPGASDVPELFAEPALVDGDGAS